MIKKIIPILSLLMLIVFSNNLSAQLANGSVAPDFTGTDLEGNTHNLYDLLDEGYIVVLDMFATWCPPCWDYHNGGILEELYDAHGPEGDNTLRVFMIEADGGTSTECLYGPGECQFNGAADPSASLGDWTEGVHYPIIDDASIGETFEIAYYPTIYTVYPNRVVIESGQQPSVAAYEALFTPDNYLVPAGLANDIGVLNHTYNEQYCQEATASFSIQNLGSDILTSFDATLFVDGVETETVNWTGSAPPFSLVEVAFTPAAVAAGSTFSVEVSNPNGVEDTNTAGEQNVYLGPAVVPGLASEGNIAMELYTDAWPEETSWEIIDDMGSVIYTSPDYSGQQYQTFNEVFDLDPGCYEFKIYDSYGDGMFATQWGQAEDGLLTLTTASGEVIYAGFEYGAGASFSFEIFEGVALEVSVAADVNEEGVLNSSVTSNTDVTVEWTVNGETFTGETLEYAFTENGEYTVTAVVTAANGQVETITETITVAVAATALFTYEQNEEGGTSFTLTNTSTFAETLMWDLGDGTTIEGEDIVLHDYEFSGDYEICLTAANAAHPDGDQKCETVSVTQGDAVGVLDVQGMSGLSLFPVPADEFVNVEFSLNTAKDLEITLTDVSGKVVRTIAMDAYTAGTHTLSINTAEMASGIYMLNILAEQQMTSQRFVVSH